MKIEDLKNKLWVRLFLKIAVIFLVFVAVLCIANSSLLLEYYEYSEKSRMVEISKEIDKIDLSSQGASSTLSNIIIEDGYSLKISDAEGKVMFSTFDFPVADYKGSFPGKGTFPELEKGNHTGFFEQVASGNPLLTYGVYLSGGEYLQLSIRMAVLENSADIANKFIAAVALVCLGATLVWVLLLSRKIAKPIKEMNDITKGMANLDFSRKITPDSRDEIGQLASSINLLSESLYATLYDLEEKNRSLRNEIEAERRLDKMRKGFVADVSHELKTPISIISGYAEGIKLSKGNEKRREEYTDVILKESARMNELVLNLLELSRLESGSSSLKPEVYDISEQFSELIKIMSASLEEKNANINNELETGLCVFADSNRISQVISNFLSNAASHVKEDGEIRIWNEDLGDHYKISVFNEGEKIPRENMEHIWESFFRGEQSHKREKERFGLGLSIVKAIIEMHSLSCGVYNSENGVIFWFTVAKAESFQKAEAELQA